MKSLVAAVFLGCVLAYAQAHVGVSGWSSLAAVERVLDMADTVSRNQEYLDVCGDLPLLAADLDNLAGCQNLTHDLGILATDLLNGSQAIWNVSSDLVQIYKLLNNCTHESIFKKPKCYAQASEKIIALITGYFGRIINLSKELVVDFEDVIVDIKACFHKGFTSEILEKKIQMCKRHLLIN